LFTRTCCRYNSFGLRFHSSINSRLICYKLRALCTLAECLLRPFRFFNLEKIAFCLSLRQYLSLYFDFGDWNNRCRWDCFSFILSERSWRFQSECHFSSQVWGFDFCLLLNLFFFLRYFSGCLFRSKH
jgi:hypothetical protein